MIKFMVKVSYWLTIIPPAWTAVVSAVKAINSMIDSWRNYNG